MAKKKIGEIYNKPIVIGDKNLMNNNEIHVDELGGGMEDDILYIIDMYHNMYEYNLTKKLYSHATQGEYIKADNVPFDSDQNIKNDLMCTLRNIIEGIDNYTLVAHAITKFKPYYMSSLGGFISDIKIKFGANINNEGYKVYEGFISFTEPFCGSLNILFEYEDDGILKPPPSPYAGDISNINILEITDSKGVTTVFETEE
jgi:hypothetical protein